MAESLHVSEGMWSPGTARNTSTAATRSNPSMSRTTRDWSNSASSSEPSAEIVIPASESARLARPYEGTRRFLTLAAGANANARCNHSGRSTRLAIEGNSASRIRISAAGSRGAAAAALASATTGSCGRTSFCFSRVSVDWAELCPSISNVKIRKRTIKSRSGLLQVRRGVRQLLVLHPFGRLSRI